MRAAAAMLIVAAGCSAGAHGGSDGGGVGGSSGDLGVGGAGGAPITLLSAGSYVDLVLTPDDIALVTDAQQMAWAIPLAGGAPAMLEPHVAAVVRAGDAVFIWHDLDAQVCGGLAVFVGGQLRELTMTTPPGIAFPDAVASDGNHIAFFGSFANGRADLIAESSDGTEKRTLTTRLDLSDDCAPSIGLVGGKVIASRCNSGGFVISAYDPDSGTSANLLSPAAAGFVPVAALSSVIVANPMNGSSLVPVAGGSATPLSGDVKRSAPLGDGTAVVQLTFGGALVRARLPDGGLTSLVASGGGDLEAVSGDGNWVLYTGAPDAAGGDAALYLAGAVQSSAAATAINSDKTTPPLTGGRFSDDAAWTLYLTGADADGHGALRARPLAGGIIGAENTLSLASTGFLTAGGGRVVFADHFAASGSTTTDAGSGASAGTIDLQLIDLADNAAPTLLVGDVSPLWRLSDDRQTLVLIVSDGKSPGLYTLPMP